MVIAIAVKTNPGLGVIGPGPPGPPALLAAAVAEARRALVMESQLAPLTSEWPEYMPGALSNWTARIATGDVEREIKRRGIYIEAVVIPPVTGPITFERDLPLPEVVPWRVETPVIEPWLPLTMPETPVIEPWLPMTLPDVLTVPETRVVVLPGEEGISPIIEPWLPVFPYLDEQEITELYTPPYPEEELLTLLPAEVPEPEAPSKAPMIIAVAVLALVALTDFKKGKKGKKAKKINNSARVLRPNEGG